MELKPGIDLLGPVEEIFFDTYDRYEPTNHDASDNCFISTVSIYTSFCSFKYPLGLQVFVVLNSSLLR